MATSNGPWQNRGRIEWYWTVSGSGASRTVYAEAYLRMDQYASTAHNGTLSYSGAWGSGSGNPQVNVSANSRTIIRSASWTESLTDSARSVSISISIAQWHGTTGSTLGISLPAKVPSTPTGLSITRVSDSSHTLTWTRNSTYTAVVVQRRENSGSGWSAWSQVGRPTGNAQTYTDTTTRANRQYQYRVAGVSAGGQSGWSNTPTVYTTPAAVTAVTAQKADLNIEVTATGLPPYATAYRIEDNGAQVATGVTSFPWLHSAPNPSVTHTYKVYAMRDSLVSAGRESNTVQLLTAPNTPTGLSPNGAVLGSDSALNLSWTHNPVDTTAQSGFELRWRYVFDTWTTISGTTQSTASIAPDPDTDIEWQVRTRGQYSGANPWSPWSALATVAVAANPGVAINSPDPVWGEPRIVAEWSFFQARNRPQTSWELQLLDGDGSIVEARSGGGSTGSLVLDHRAGHDESYTLRVRAATGSAWSAWAVQPFEVVFIEPAPAAVDSAWDEESGAMELSINANRGPEIPDIVNHFTNPNLVGDGTWAEVRRNLCMNPSFEVDTSHWVAAEGIDLRRGYGPNAIVEGNWAAHVEALPGADPNNVQLITELSEISEGQYASVRIPIRRGTTGVYQTLSIGVNWYNGSTYISAQYTGYEPIGTGSASLPENRRESLLGPAPAGTTRARIVFRLRDADGLSPAPVGSLAHFDAVMFGVGSTEAEASYRTSDYFDGNTTPGAADGVIQPEDFRWRWLGAENVSESVMEIERVRGLSGWQVINGVSTWGGVPAVRQISTGANPVAYSSFPIPDGAKTSGTLMATRNLMQPLAGELWDRAGRVYAAEPTQVSDPSPNESGAHPLRLHYSGLVSPPTSLAVLPHGGTQGSGDVWWTDIGLFAGDYDGPWFAGDSGAVRIDESYMQTKWDGEPNNSNSILTMGPETQDVLVERSVDDGRTWETFIPRSPFVSIEDELNVSDWQSLSCGTTIYRVTTYAPSDASSVMTHEAISDSMANFLNGGPSFSITSRLPGDPAVSITGGRVRATEEYAGRSLPVAYSSRRVSRSVNVGGTIMDKPLDEDGNPLAGEFAEASRDDLEELSLERMPLHQHRDPYGNRIVGSLSQINLSQTGGFKTCGEGCLNTIWAFDYTIVESGGYAGGSD